VGLATVEQFVAEGAQVVFTDIPAQSFDELVKRLGEEKASVHYRNRQKGGPNDGEAIADRLGSNARFRSCRHHLAEELANVIDTAVTEFGGLDVMFNNCGGRWRRRNDRRMHRRHFRPDHRHQFERRIWRGMKFAAPHIMARGGDQLFRAVPDCHS